MIHAVMIETTLGEGVLMQDMAWFAGSKGIGTAEFAQEMIARLT